MKIAIYSRKSKFTGKGESTQNQIEMCKEYASKHFEVDGYILYEDEGFSGGNVDRPQYKRMIKDAQNGKFNVLMCYRLDRVSRNISDFSDTLETLQKNDISFVSIKEQFDTSTPMGRAMMYIASVFAQLERETIAERIRDNMLQLARSGRWLGGRTPTGYTSEPIVYYDAEMQKKTMYKLTGVHDELELVKTIFNKYLELRSLNQIEVWSTTNNIKTKTGKYFDITASKSILTNMVYVKADYLMYEYCSSQGMDIASNENEFDGKHGLMVYNKNAERKGKSNKLRDKSEWIVAVGKHKGIIDSYDFIKIQEQLEENKLKAPREGTSKIGLLNTLLRCKHCNSRFRIMYGTKRADGTRPHYYKCRLKEKTNGTRCKVKNLIGEQVDKEVIDYIIAQSSEDSDYFKEITKNVSNLKEKSKFYDINTNNLSKELKEYENIIENLTLQLGQNQNSIASKYIINQIETLDQKITKLKNEINNINDKKELTLYEQKNNEMTKSLLRDFKLNVDKLDNEELKKALGLIVDKIVWDGENLEIEIY